MKKLILCADDYGQNEAISAGIRHCVEGQRLSAVSCMVTTPHWPAAAKALNALHADVDIGLHLNFTEGDGYTPLKCLMGKTFSRRLPLSAAEAEITRQLAVFTQAMGKQPDFIDGHQHVQQLPVIRSALLNVYQRTFTNARPYIRLSTARNWRLAKARGHTLKQIIIGATGARALRTQLRKHHIPHNQDFAGVYDFSPQSNYAQQFKGWLSSLTDGTLMMCHPGLHSDDDSDAIRFTRDSEYHYLQSEQFIQELKQFNIQLTRFQEHP